MKKLFLLLIATTLLLAACNGDSVSQDVDAAELNTEQCSVEQNNLEECLEKDDIKENSNGGAIIVAVVVALVIGLFIFKESEEDGEDVEEDDKSSK